MSTLVLGERPPELGQLPARRRALGQDLLDLDVADVVAAVDQP